MNLRKAVDLIRETVRRDYPDLQPEYSPNHPNLRHVLWMCDEILLIENRHKAMRWLGFAQGVMWMTDLLSIEEMKETNRG